MSSTLTSTDYRALGWTAVFDTVGALLFAAAGTVLLLMHGMVWALFGAFTEVPPPDVTSYVARTGVAVTVTAAASVVALLLLPRSERVLLSGLAAGGAGTVVGAIVLLALFNLI